MADEIVFVLSCIRVEPEKIKIKVNTREKEKTLQNYFSITNVNGISTISAFEIVFVLAKPHEKHRRVIEKAPPHELITYQFPNLISSGSNCSIVNIY